MTPSHVFAAAALAGANVMLDAQTPAAGESVPRRVYAWRDWIEMLKK